MGRKIMNKMTGIRILCLVMLVLIGLCQFSQAASMIPEKKIAALKEGNGLVIMEE